MQDCSLALGVVVGEVVREIQVVLGARVCSYKFKKKSVLAYIRYCFLTKYLYTTKTYHCCCLRFHIEYTGSRLQAPTLFLENFPHLRK